MEAGGGRAFLPAGVWLALRLSGFRTAAAQTAADSVQVTTRDKLRALFATYGPARDIRWYRSDDPFVLAGFLDKGLTHTPRFEVYVSVTERKTIWIRVYPQFGEHINLDEVSDRTGLMRKLLRLSYHNFFWWGANDDLDVFAGFEFTLESGFPEEAIKVVIRSIPLIDQPAAEILSFIE